MCFLSRSANPGYVPNSGNTGVQQCEKGEFATGLTRRSSTPISQKPATRAGWGRVVYDGGIHTRVYLNLTQLTQPTPRLP